VSTSVQKSGLPVLFINFILILYPATVLFVPKMNGIIFALLAIAGLYSCVRVSEMSFKFNFDEKIFFQSISIFFVVVLSITLNAGFVYKAIGKYLHLILAIPIYMYLRHIGFRLAYFWYGLVLGSIIAAGVAMYDVWVIKSFRARSLTHPIIFGDLALIMGYMSLAGLGWFRKKSLWQTVLPIVALLCSVFASVLAEARGSWLAVPFLFVVLFWYVRSLISFKLKLGVALSVGVFFWGVYTIPQTEVGKHVDRAINNVKIYNNSEITSPNRSSSVGTRLEMWQASWTIFLNNPILGVGWGHYQEEAVLQIKQGLRNKSAAAHDHPHSQYFAALANGGLLGIVVTIMLFLIPAWLFIKYIRLQKTEDSKRLALAGLLLVVAYMIFCLSETLLERSRSVNFFAFYLVVIMAAINREQVCELSDGNGSL